MAEKGTLEVICGCMFSGKTEELVRRIKREQIAKRKIQVFKSHLDTRYALQKISTHDGITINATVVPESNPNYLKNFIEDDTNVIAIDEIQFFHESIVTLCNFYAEEGKRVIVAGLDMDFRGEPFNGPIQPLLAIADRVDKLTAVCVKCGAPATRTQRLVNGIPANWDEATLVIGAYEKYEAVCRDHHIITKP